MLTDYIFSTFTLPHVVAGIFIASGIGCSLSNDGDTTCRREQPIFLGPDTQIIDLPIEVKRNIGALFWRNQENIVSALCTVTRVTKGWAITAAHCFEHGTGQSDDLTSRVETARLSFSNPIPSNEMNCSFLAELVGTEATSSILVHSVTIHPLLDIALVSFDDVVVGDALDLSERFSTAELEVTLAGFGLTEDGSQGRLRFLPSLVHSRNDTAFIVDSGSDAGACSGDSGGPALQSDGSTWFILGTLTQGSPSCTGLDQYIDISQASVRAWLDKTVNNQNPQ